MELLFSVVIGKHILVFSNELIVLILEIFYKVKFMIHPCQ